MRNRDNRTEFIKARVTPEERIRADQNATILNLTMSDMIRLFILEGAPEKAGMSADDRSSLNLILRYLQQTTTQNAPTSPEIMTAVVDQLAALIRRIEDSLD